MRSIGTKNCREMKVSTIVMLMAWMPFTVHVLGFSGPCDSLSPVWTWTTCPTSRCRRRVPSTYLLYASQNEDESSSHSASPADTLLNMVEEIASGQFSPEIVAKMQELEQSLADFLNTQGKEKYQQKWSPRPPGTPPPLRILQNLDRQQDSLVKAEIALEKLRDRLRRGEEALRRAEEALQQSLQEEEILRRAEEALQRSREAAEKRKLEAIRQTEAAVASAEQARKDSEEAARAWGQQPSIPSFDTRNEGTNNSVDTDDDNVDDGSSTNDEDFAYYRKMDTPRSTIPLGFLTRPNPQSPTNAVDTVPDNDPMAPVGIPILYNWVQYIDGSIQGQVRNSQKFEDGAVIATSPVENGANMGTIIETSSGSRYYLGTPNEIKGRAAVTEGTTDGWNIGTTDNPIQPWSTATFPNMAKAPDGVPSIVGWKTLENGGVAGLIFGSRNAENGDYIETSPIANGSLESGQVVTTISGSRYFLSPDEEDRAANAIAAFQDLVEARKGSTITITKNLAFRSGSTDTKESTNVDMPVRSAPETKPRPTFSLFDLFGKGDQNKIRQTGGKTGPGGVPMLSNWNANPDGTITGIVSGSPHLNDGDMVTTSPIVSGTVKQYEKVITETGSTYYLS